MMAHTWNKVRAEEHIQRRLEEVSEVTVVDYVRDKSLDSIPINKAYRVDGVHLYADILNLQDILGTTDVEGVRCHQRALRFLNLHYRAVNRILSRTDVKRVDFHNQRLHALVAKPYNTDNDAEAKRIRRSVAVGQLIIDVLAQVSDASDDIPPAEVRVGIDSGKALAVNNGRNGHREPLFLGNPANQAAKYAGGGSTQGIFLTNNARLAIGLSEVEKPKQTKLTRAEIKACQEDAQLDVTVQSVVDAWKKDLADLPIGVFQFTRHTPPFRTMPISDLTPRNSRRQEAVSLYADVDGFTAYVNRHILDNAENVVKALHVIRAELERTLTNDFDGRRIRFIGDCLHGLLCEGTAQTTDIEETISVATLCSGGLRSGFELALEMLDEQDIDINGLGLQIGFEYGWMTVTRLGMQGDRVRCSVSRGVLRSEEEQMRCKGNETAIGPEAYKKARETVRTLFGTTCKVQDLDYVEAADALAKSDDKTAKAATMDAYAGRPAVATAASRIIAPYTK